MANALFCFEPIGAHQDVYDALPGYRKEKKRKQNDLVETENLDVIDPCGDEKQIPLSDIGVLEDVPVSIDSPLIQMPDEAMNVYSVLSEPPKQVEIKKDNPFQFSTSLLELLKTYDSGLKLNGEQLNTPQSDTTSVTNGRILSTEEIMRVAGARFIQFFVPSDGLSMLQHPFGYALSGLSYEESQDVELAHLLLASAEKVGNQQFDRASKLLTQCQYLSSTTGNPVQRVVYYFAEALQERINRETGRSPWKSLGGKGRQAMDIIEALRTPHPAVVECHQLLPFSQVLQFAGMQAIVDSIASAKKVHLIDLGIKSGMPWTILMHALAARRGCQLENLKITAIATTSQKKIEETGKKLASFAKNMNLPFTFNIVFVPDMTALKKELFKIEEGEVIAVHSHLALRDLLHRPGHLEALMTVIKTLKPCIMVVGEVEANHNSPVLMNRFIEALFYYSTFFDCLEACMDRKSQNRMVLEQVYLAWGIQNIVATEGEERTTRNVGIDVWRAFFRRFGLVETELSHTSLYQASLIVEKFARRSSCTVDMNGKCLILGWKGTPIHSLSTWKFK